MNTITINNLVIDKWLSNYDVNIVEQFSSQGFTAVDGTQVNSYVGDRRILVVKLEPMSTSQINDTFKAIKSNRESIPITFTDPQLGKVTKNFTCPTLPSATWFESDDGRQFWTIPDITFQETDKSAGIDSQHL